MARRGSGTPTLTDVAALAGVSPATASKALNGRDEVAPATRAKVLEAAEKLAFRPNALARSLVSGNTSTIGLLTSDSGGRFSIPVLLGAENALGDNQISVLLADARGDAIRERHYVRTLLAQQVAGLIVVGESSNRRPSIGRDVPVPVVYAYAESTDPQDLSFLPDDRGGAKTALEHLYSLGRRRIAHITGPVDYRATVERVNGLNEFLDDAGLALAGRQVRYGEWSQRWGRHAAEFVLNDDPDVDAIFCGSDQVAAGVTETLAARGVRVPDDIALVGFDNWEIFSTETSPPLTTVDMNLQRLGAIASQHLFAAIGGEQATGIRHLPCRLVIRDSSGGR
ncbi:LacI family transcriptional regulator [Kibdelosporangium aridum]|uniref:LacI family transcriptional regulator n=1 Tax=Kibdelosporangium aridum TaxID=2030 RepID=A0A428ZJ46_KIBAR|nr:LacI family DNA-binding transcriptional regulator [Kibdelosporangium aridum]RSM87980.1 LacI family transcriptional regulator [Kibdelosporangium aridum]